MIYRFICAAFERDLTLAELDALTSDTPWLAARIARCQQWARVARPGDRFDGFMAYTVWALDAA